MEDLSMLFSIPDSFPLIEVLIQKVAKVIHGNMAVLATATKPPEADSTCRRCRYCCCCCPADPTRHRGQLFGKAIRP
jgi:hypothetical protein